MSFISWPPGDEPDFLIDGGMPWTLHEPLEGASAGVAVDLGGNKYVRRALLERGWAVLQTPGPDRYFRRRADPPLFEIRGPQDIDRVAGEIARLFDDEMAEWAYGAEAVMLFLRDKRPDLPRNRSVLLGFSVGALAAPAVAARQPDEFKAALLVAGGADLLYIARRTAKPDSGLLIDWGDLPVQESEPLLRQAYLVCAKLDPWNAVAALQDRPVLIYHAAFDQVVPAAAGDALFDRLEHARRFVYPAGHGLLLRTIMRLHAGALVDRIEECFSPPT